MLPILGPEAIRAADAWTMAHEPISSLDLMERAALACTERIIARYVTGPSAARFAVLCGPGNNGGDGLAIARQLKERGLQARAVRVGRERVSADNATNWERAVHAGVPCTAWADDGDFQVADDELVIDALFGIGLRGPLTGQAADAVRAINRSGRPVIAIDMPSGLMTEDNATNEASAIVRASVTYTFEVPKLAFLLPENERHVGDWGVVPIGLDSAFIERQAAQLNVIERADIVELLPARERFAHKGRFGHAMLIAGSLGKMGAAVLSTRAALRSGAGLVTTHVAAAGRDVVQSSAPEAMCSVDPMADRVSTLPDLQSFTAVGLGPGIGLAEESRAVVKRLIQTTTVPCVIDADGLNAIAEDPTWGAFLPAITILTPHPKEFDRLFGKPSSSGYERLQRARELAQRWQCHIVLKGAWTATCTPQGRVFFNPTGNAGMAKGGSGDALTGLLTGLLAQGLDPLSVCILGTYVHGLAGDIAARKLGMDGMTAGDLIEALPEAWMDLRKA